MTTNEITARLAEIGSVYSDSDGRWIHKSQDEGRRLVKELTAANRRTVDKMDKAPTLHGKKGQRGTVPCPACGARGQEHGTVCDRCGNAV